VRGRIPFAVGAVLLLAGCPAHRAAVGVVPDDPEEVTLDPVEIVAGGEEALALASLNDQELFQVGTAAFAAGDFEGAARAFSLIVHAHPDSDLAGVAAYNAGFSWERMGEYLTALDYYGPLLDHFAGRDWLDAAFRIADSLYHLEDHREAARLLGRVLEIEGLPPNDRMRALVLQGVCLLEAGHEEEAEHSLRSAVGRYHIEHRRGEDRVDVYFAAKGQFHLGELYRMRFERARLDPAESDFETLADDLEHKAQLLLSAQGHYLRTIRMGEGRWAAAAGHQVGRLYEELYRQITSARMPTGLDGAAQRLAYQELLQEKVRILLEKSMEAYERTLSTAERIGVEGAWRGRIEASLERVKSLLLEDGMESPAS
jgi:tetratricopeptide (TPR) repeat protein